MKKILVVCGTGAATSTIVATKVKEFCEIQGIKVEIFQGKATEVKSYSGIVDLVVSTTLIDDDYQIPIVKAINLLTGFNEGKVYDLILKHLKE